MNTGFSFLGDNYIRKRINPEKATTNSSWYVHISCIIVFKLLYIFSDPIASLAALRRPDFDFRFVVHSWPPVRFLSSHWQKNYKNKSLKQKNISIGITIKNIYYQCIQHTKCSTSHNWQQTLKRSESADGTLIVVPY